MAAEAFTSVRTTPDDAFEIQNVLSIRQASRVVNERTTPLVNVDTNYKDTRRGEHPVNLSMVDAVKAARALVEASARAYGRMIDDDPAQSWDLLSALSAVDAEVSDLRDSLLLDLKPKEA
jgi:hypothetical protein